MLAAGEAVAWVPAGPVRASLARRSFAGCWRPAEWWSAMPAVGCPSLPGLCRDARSRMVGVAAGLTVQRLLEGAEPRGLMCLHALAEAYDLDVRAPA